jgi:hypothetical protein
MPRVRLAQEALNTTIWGIVTGQQLDAYRRKRRDEHRQRILNLRNGGDLADCSSPPRSLRKRVTHRESAEREIFGVSSGGDLASWLGVGWLPLPTIPSPPPVAVGGCWGCGACCRSVGRRGGGCPGPCLVARTEWWPVVGLAEWWWLLAGVVVWLVGCLVGPLFHASCTGSCLRWSGRAPGRIRTSRDGLVNPVRGLT